MAERQVPSTKKATEHREETKPNKVPSWEEPDLLTLVAGQQPQLQREHQPPNIIISDAKPLTQGEDGPEEPRPGQRPSHPPPPPSTSDDVDIFRQSFIQVGMH